MRNASLVSLLTTLHVVNCNCDYILSGQFESYLHAFISRLPFIYTAGEKTKTVNDCSAGGDTPFSCSFVHLNAKDISIY